MKPEKFTILLLLACLIEVGIKNVHCKGVDAGTIITNWAQVEYTYGLSPTNHSISLSTQVMAIYGMTPVTGLTNGFTYPGGTVLFDYSFTNNGNIAMQLIVTLSNFIMTNNYTGSNWKAWLSMNTSQTIIGTNIQSISYTNNIPIGASTSYTLHIQTADTSKTYDWGRIPIITFVTTSGIRAAYNGDNNIFYGGTNFNILYPKVTINAPFIALKKTISISNMPIYLADGGMTNIPVPDAVLTYTNYYDNDGNAKATNLIIIDRIPYHTDFIIGSINTASIHSNANVSISYRERSGSFYIPTGAIGTSDQNIAKIIFTFSGSSVDEDENTEGTDTSGTADGQFPDTDAGYVFYKVVVHRRE